MDDLFTFSLSTQEQEKDQMDMDKILNGRDINEQIGLLKNCLGTICDGLFHLYYQWRISIDVKNVSESDAIAQCILQMVVCRNRTLLVMCDGVNVRPENDTNRILDIPSMISVLRSLYEMVFIFHNIYAEQETEKERDIVLYLWEIRGLNNRQNLPIVPSSFKGKEEDEKKQIEYLKRNIEKIAANLNLSDELKGQLTKVMTSKSVDIKGYRFKKDCESNSIIAFKDYRYEEGAEALLKTDAPTYRFLSIHGHPSYLGVLQFGQMFANDTDKSFLRTILTCACKLSSTIATDFHKNICGADIIFSQLPENEKGFITTLQNC